MGVALTSPEGSIIYMCQRNVNSITVYANYVHTNGRTLLK